jgi:adenosylcobinamide kinase/adenosylcobinamide-phosphate guanylyltransferase
MGKIIVITGGARSGKSRYAEGRVLELGGEHYYLATCPRIAGDEDLDSRIARHQEIRQDKGWVNFEEVLEVEKVLEQAASQGTNVLFECLGTWVGNLLWEQEQGRLDVDFGQDEVWERVQSWAQKWQQEANGTLVVIAPEAGMGLVPVDAESRKWLDWVGNARNHLAAMADEVWLTVSGIPLQLK